MPTCLDKDYFSMYTNPCVYCQAAPRMRVQHVPLFRKINRKQVHQKISLPRHENVLRFLKLKENKAKKNYPKIVQDFE